MAVAFALAVGLTLVGRVAARLAARAGAPGEVAQWIWVAHERRDPAPAAFYAVRDFMLAAAPRRARLLAVADEEYVLYLNGKRVGAGRYLVGAPLDVYEVGPLLRHGGNRLLAELRSGRGAGGFLASLEDEASGARLVVTDGSWRTFGRHRLGLMRGWLPVAGPGAPAGPGEGAPAFCWGPPPLGRWGSPEMPRHAAPRPVFAELTGGRAPVPAMVAAPYVPPAASGLAPDEAMMLFDWGREVEGYLAFEPGWLAGGEAESRTAPAERLRTALLYTWIEPPAPPALPALSAGAPSGAVLLIASGREWLDARPRRFRYALVIGIEPPLAARVYEVAPASSGVVAADDRPPRGVYGIEPPPRQTPLEDEIRHRLEQRRLEQRRPPLHRGPSTQPSRSPRPPGPPGPPTPAATVPNRQPDKP